MAVFVRIFSVSLLTAVLGALLGLMIFPKYSDYIIPILFLACVGGVIGVVAGSAREIVMVLNRKASH